jgi:hypothetical protein
MTFQRPTLTRIGNLLCDAIMWDNIKGILRFAKQHGSAILAVSGAVIALSGVMISVCSLYLTIKSQREDHFYKELSIKPSLGFSVRPGELTVSFPNQGLGPAQIMEAVFFVSGQCLNLYRSGTIDHEKDAIYHEIYYPGIIDQEAERLLIDSLRSRLLTDVFGGEPMPLLYRTQMLIPSLVTVGSEVVIFGLEKSVVEPFHDWIKELGRQKAQPLLDKFNDRALALALSMRYCSMSGEYCRDVIRKGDATEACPLSTK